MKVVKTAVWVLALVLPDVLDLSLCLDGLFGVNVPGCPSELSEASAAQFSSRFT